MSYLDESGLSTYDSSLKEWISSQNTKTIPSNIYPWTKTVKASAVSCYPVGGTELKPVVDFLFTEIPPASGDKGPDNPSTITGVSSIGLTVCQEEDVDEHEYSLSLGNTYYGGSLDVAAGQMTVTVQKDSFVTPYNVPSDLQDATYVTFQMRSLSAHSSNSDLNLSCNMFATSGDGEKLYLRGGVGASSVALKMLKSRLDMSEATDPLNPTEAELKAAYNAWAMTHNVEFTYTVYNPFTVQSSPTEILSLAQNDKYTPKLNTIYSDQTAVQVGYIKSPIREEYELIQAIVAQGGEI